MPATDKPAIASKPPGEEGEVEKGEPAFPAPLLEHLQRALCGLEPLSYSMADFHRLDLDAARQYIASRDLQTYRWLNHVQQLCKSGGLKNDSKFGHLDQPARERRRSDLIIRVNPKSAYGHAITLPSILEPEQVKDKDRIVLPQGRHLVYNFGYPFMIKCQRRVGPANPDRGWPLGEICQDISQICHALYEEEEESCKTRLPKSHESRNRPMTAGALHIGIQFLDALAIKFIVIDTINYQVYPELDSSVPYRGRSCRSICRRLSEDGTPSIEFLGKQKTALTFRTVSGFSGFT